MFLDRRVIPTEPQVAAQRGGPRVLNVRPIDQGFIMHHAGQSRTQKTYAFALCLDQHDILVGMVFLFSAIVQGLFFTVFRALPTALDAIDDQIRRFGVTPLMLRHLCPLPFRHHPKVVQRRG